MKNQHVSGLKCVGPDFELLVARGIALEGKISKVAARAVDTLTVTPASRTAESASGDALFICLAATRSRDVQMRTPAIRGVQSLKRRWVFARRGALTDGQICPRASAV